MILSMLKGFHFSSLYTFYFVFFYKLKIYISRRRLKDDLRMMVYSAHAAHHQGLLVFVVEIATVGKDSLGQQFLCIILMFQRESSIIVSLSNVRFLNSILIKFVYMQQVMHILSLGQCSTLVSDARFLDIDAHQGSIAIRQCSTRFRNAFL